MKLSIVCFFALSFLAVSASADSICQYQQTEDHCRAYPECSWLVDANHVGQCVYFKTRELPPQTPLAPITR